MGVRNLEYIKNTAAWLVIVFLVCINSNGQETRKQYLNKAEAERIWELALEAKGGREKLLSI